MPYRIKPGQKGFLVMRNGTSKEVVFNRTVDFTKKELHLSPLSEHHKEGIPSSTPNRYIVPHDFIWGFDVKEKWIEGDAANSVSFLYAINVHQITINTDKMATTVIIPGSRTNEYTVVINYNGEAESCTCPVFRFKRKNCKHMEQAELEVN